MKKSTATITLGAAAAFTALSAAPAQAFPYQTCDEAAAAAVYNIPVGSPAYTAALDVDGDGIACESDLYVYRPEFVPGGTTEIRGAEPQVGQMPVGGADTGVAQDPVDTTASSVLGAGLVLAAVAGATFVVRRREATA
ncbi:excalibur calcium-binding domain-containing protein [Arthrobacter sp. MDB2-24]